MSDIMEDPKVTSPATQSIFPHGVATEEEKRIFAPITHPDDSYTLEGVYWADLPFFQRAKWVISAHFSDAAEELRTVGQMVKEDPLSPFSWYWWNAVLPGAGLLLEGYVLFSIGNLAPLFKAVWPTCWGSSKPGVCDANWIASVTYLEIVGIMIGQAVVGIQGDWLGRRHGLIQDASIMWIGLTLLVAMWAPTLQGWVIMYGWSLFVYGFGVGGEYPITATSALEHSATSGHMASRDDRMHRGRRVTSAFLMQGWGQFLNQCILMILLLIFNRHDGNPGDGPYSKLAGHAVMRISFFIPWFGTGLLTYYRTYKMRDAGKQLELAKKKANITGYDVNALKSCFTVYGGRLLATSGAWFANDVFFYGNKLFQSQFIKVISDNPNSLIEQWKWSLINIVVSMCGYYLASLLIDHKLYGRKMMQQVGFLACFIFFVIPAFHFDYYKRPENIHSFQAMYFLSSFFNQFGPNSVTFLVAGEVFPTQIRASAHGFSACIGKSGALLASVLYNYIDDQTKFYFVPWFGLAGMFLTWFFLPDTTGLDLREQERRWNYISSGREKEYHGIAVHPVHLSLWERLRGVSKTYNPELDHSEKIRDLKAEWIAHEQDRGLKETDIGAENEMFTAEINQYMRQHKTVASTASVSGSEKKA